MAIQPANVGPQGLDIDWTALKRHAGPVVVMLHGFKFSPTNPAHSPHKHILSPTPVSCHWKAKSWPVSLGLEQHPDVLGIPLGWEARGSIWNAHANATQTGAALARLVQGLQAQVPGRRISLMGHSLGARVILKALTHLDGCSVHRAVLLAAAAFQSEAHAAIDATAGRTCEIMNVTSRENDFYNFMLETLIAKPCPKDRGLGMGLGTAPARWVDVPLDSARTLQALAGLDFRIAPAKGRICHWSTYLRPGVFDLYRAFLITPDALPISILRSVLSELRSHRRSHLLRLPLHAQGQTS